MPSQSHAPTGMPSPSQTPHSSIIEDPLNTPAQSKQDTFEPPQTPSQSAMTKFSGVLSMPLQTINPA